jgi:hypothetical protein
MADADAGGGGSTCLVCRLLGHHSYGAGMQQAQLQVERRSWHVIGCDGTTFSRFVNG